MGWNKGVSIIVGFFLTMHLAAAVGQESSATSLGLLEIGGKLNKIADQLESDCDKTVAGGADCEGVDSVGRIYSFYQGRLIRVSLSAQSVKKKTKLPAGLVFGEDINVSAHKLRKILKIRLMKGESDGGGIGFSSGFDVRGHGGWNYSIAIIADAQGNLVEIVERANIP